ncbi:MAG: hypothetical protein RLZZ53_3261, partial [Acidobacteriota bacterium]
SALPYGLKNVMLSTRRITAFAITLMLLCLAATAAAQIWRGGFGGRTPPRFATINSFGGGFNFCRVMFTSDHREKQGWSTDYPGADINFSVRIAELTKIQVKMQDDGEGGGDPDAIVVRLTDDALFKCPFIFMEDAGTMRMRPQEAARLQDYLLKGGFLLVSDYHGSWAREQFEEEIGKVLPPSRFPVRNLTPPNDHAMWKTMFPVSKLPQMASIATWRRTGGDIIERWNEDASPPAAYGIADEDGRLMVVMVHNTDLPDPWEREGEDKGYFYQFSPDAYAVGIDILLYSMTH